MPPKLTRFQREMLEAMRGLREELDEMRGRAQAAPVVDEAAQAAAAPMAAVPVGAVPVAAAPAVAEAARTFVAAAPVAAAAVVIAPEESMRKEMKDFMTEVRSALSAWKEGGRAERGKEEVLTAHSVAKRWTKWVSYVLGGDSEAGCLDRIDLLVQQIRAQFDLARMGSGGLVSGMAEPALDGIIGLLSGVVRGAADPEVVEPALEAFGKQLTTAQRVETHSADSAVALAAALRAESTAEPEVQHAIAGMPAGLRVPRWRAARETKRAGRWQQAGGGSGGRGAAKRGRAWEGESRAQNGACFRKPGNGVGGVGRS
jgi:hypothetical protein